MVHEQLIDAAIDTEYMWPPYGIDVPQLATCPDVRTYDQINDERVAALEERVKVLEVQRKVNAATLVLLCTRLARLEEA